MKTKLLLLAFALGLLAPAALSLTGCSTPPASRTAEVTTLRTLGLAAQGSIDLSAQLYRDGHITAEQARAIAEFYDNTFQPAYRLAAAAVQQNLDTSAPANLVALASQLAALVVRYQSQHS